ncbi:hypothetical protein D3C72_2395330 [compost metagenome]
MRADAVGRELADAGKMSAAVVDADHAAIAREVVFGGVEQAAIGGKAAVAVEMPAFGGGDDHRLGAAIG